MKFITLPHCLYKASRETMSLMENYRLIAAVRLRLVLVELGSASYYYRLVDKNY